MSTRAVTIAGPDRRTDIVVPAETPIRELLPTFVDLGLHETPDPRDGEPVWAVQPPNGSPLPPERTLAECEIADGDILVLTQLRSQAVAPPKPSAQRRRPEPASKLRPRAKVAAALPQRLSRTSRIAESTKAFFGHGPEPDLLESSEPGKETARQRLTKTEEPSPTQRYRARWRETDYFERLDQAVAAPRLQRCATIAIV